MSDMKVTQLLNDLALADAEILAIVQATRALIYSVVPDASERVMYGGFMFSAAADFCGVFAYQKHVSLEFGRGCDLSDPAGVLEGRGQFRRHIKLRCVADLEAKSVAQYLSQAQAASR